jgi:enterochelin esterase-like enzyme
MRRLQIIIFLFFNISVFAQNKPEKKTIVKKDHGYTIGDVDKSYGVYLHFHSDSMNKDFPVLVFLPKGYQETTKSFPVVYSLHGVNNNALTEDGIRSMFIPETGYQEAADEYRVIIVCPLVGNKFYINSPIFKQDKYATLIAVELVRLIESKYRVIKNRHSRILQGFSMGGYGAVSLLCRYPEVFCAALSRGGALSDKALIEDLHWDDASIEALGNMFENPQIYHLHSIENLLNKIKEREDVAIVLEVGRDDFLYSGNVRINEKLKTCKFPFIFAQYPGGHEWSRNALNSLLSHLQYFVPTKTTK